MPHGGDQPIDAEGARRRASWVVGIGASAGGLEAISELLAAVSAETRAAFVVIQHLDPALPSALGAILGRATAMRVVDAADGAEVEPATVYVVTAGAELGVRGGRLVVTPRIASPAPRRPIDAFLADLARDLGSHAVGVVLSGNAADGTEGLRAIKAAGGLTFAQDPASAKHRSMPESALAAGVVDRTALPAEIGAELSALGLARDASGGAGEPPTEIVTELIALLRETTGRDFSSYRRSTASRRIARRMVVRRCERAADYLALARSDRDETLALAEDLLIHVTGFFRDREVFDVLATSVLPEIVRPHLADGSPIRLWVPGCATGEEAYTLAILLLEILGSRSANAVQIFGSDLSPAAIATARAGRYSEDRLAGMTAARLDRFFTRTAAGDYRVTKAVRDCCIFAAHDLVRDPPFSHLDLISCRNVLIYFQPELQKRLLRLFHQCLEQPGYLVLGRSESAAAAPSLFREAAVGQRVFERLAAPRRASLSNGPWLERRAAPQPAVDDALAERGELQSANEELQSTNEELETAKEELESSNEELITLNEELRARNREVTGLVDDLNNVFDAIDVAVVLVDEKHRIRRFTPRAAALFRILPTDVGRPFHDLRSPFTVPDLEEALKRSVGALQYEETEARDEGGQWWRLQVRPYRTAERRVEGAILTAVDIHAIKTALGSAVSQRDDALAARTTAEGERDRAERADRAKDDFLATLSHELRTPLTSMLLHARRIGSGQLDLEETQRASESIVHAVRAQTQLIEDLLDVSRIITGKLVLQSRPVQLARVCRAAVDAVRPAFNAKGVLLDCTLDESLGLEEADETRLTQVVWNLLGNAVKFTPRGGHVELRLERAANHTRISVEDDGAGIDPAHLPHLFDRFNQGHVDTTRTHGGLGLGLAIARHLVEVHGGTIRAESRGRGTGTRFEVLLPPGPTPLQTVPRTTSSGVPVPLVDARVLLVEDDDDLRASFAGVLTEAGATVCAAASAEEALARLDDFDAEVMITDLTMPGLDGFALLDRVRAVYARRGRQIPAAAASAHAGNADRARVIGAGFDLFLVKPFDGDELLSAVRRLVSRARRSERGE